MRMVRFDDPLKRTIRVEIQDTIPPDAIESSQLSPHIRYSSSVITVILLQCCSSALTILPLCFT
jgi:hypothetical protein